MESEAHALCTRCVPGTVEKLTGNCREGKSACKPELEEGLRRTQH